MATVNDYALQAIKGIKKSFDNSVQQSLEAYMDNRIIDFYSTSEFSEIFTSTEGLTGTKELAELETPPTHSLQDGYSVTISDGRYGNSILVSETQRHQAKDSTTKIDTFLTRQATALMRDVVNTMITDAFYMLNNAFNGSANTLAPDGTALLGTHTWKTGTTFDNSDTQALDSAAIDTALEYAGAFKSADGKPMPLNFDTIIVKKGSEAERTARKLFAFGIQPTAVADINIYEGEFTIVSTPYLTAANKLNWFMKDSSYDNPVKFGITEMPTMKPVKIDDNEAYRTNITGYWKKGIVNIPFSWYGSNGTT